MKKVYLSIVICTYNRSDYLSLCLNSLTPQLSDNNNVEIIVVDNNSSDNTKKIVQKIQKEVPFLTYIFEPKQGLSYARNRGGEAARGTYIGYVDDDAIVEENFIKRALNTIKKHDFDLFGGKVMPWFKYGQPRWLSDNYDSNLSPEVTTGKTGDWGALWGGVLFVKKEVFIKIGKFRTDLGMGLEMGYGEDTNFVQSAFNEKYQLGVNPNVIIYHLIRKEKMKLSWHFYSIYCKGRDTIGFTGKENAIRLLYDGLMDSIKRGIVGIKHLLFKSNYYWESYLLYVLRPLSFNLGKIVGGIKYRKRRVNESNTI